MGTRIPSHQLKSELYALGWPEQLKADKKPTMASRAVPYSGGNVKKSGELGKSTSSSHNNSESMRNSSSGEAERKR
ncbi:hypothetical protein Tsubulata_026513 [Turnera subulata]|uniref:Uncharacterized protein n=1 Tax=Turnera subulata TaxID=218843 RepID=A0A9Q0FQU5_9ROSI|nr:hypothetical protein Tsubulata_026513 [Turnera subulata]